ncbi:centrosomal protein 43-like [Tribolium madens]|uniref:centrosomal protein 43-like n=1 Tax=Tribolium madens TaxID=41895 RepID=UPI001CF7215A|nr:centrosomal protein 43-like [Tribolium madens]
MSVEEEVELRDMVAQTLELNGCLPKIRAQLRANLFLALDEDSKISKQQPLLNTKIKSHLEAPEGQLMFCLVREFLEYFNLDFTASVYEPESYVGSFYKYEGREKIIEDLGLKPTDESFSGPVLLHLLKIAQIKSKTLKINLNINSEQNGHASETDSILSKNELKNPKLENAALDSTYVKKDVENDDTFNGTSSIEEENGCDKSTNEDSTTDQDSSPKSEDKSKKSDKRKLDLPINKSRSDLLPSLYSKKSKEYDFEIKDDYEEDFMSGSEIELSGGKPLFDELQQAKKSDNKSSNSTDIETNLSVGTNSSL